MKSLSLLVVATLWMSSHVLASDARKLPPFFSVEGAAARFNFCLATLKKAPIKPELLQLTENIIEKENLSHSPMYWVTQRIRAEHGSRWDALSASPLTAWELRRFILARNQQNYIVFGNLDETQLELSRALGLLRELNPELWARTLLDQSIQKRPWSPLLTPHGAPLFGQDSNSDTHKRLILYKLLLPLYQSHRYLEKLSNSVFRKTLNQAYFNQMIAWLVAIDPSNGQSTSRFFSSGFLSTHEHHFLKTLTNEALIFLGFSDHSFSSSPMTPYQTRSTLMALRGWLESTPPVDSSVPSTSLLPPELNEDAIFSSALTRAGQGMITRFNAEFIEHVEANSPKNKTGILRSHWRLYRTLANGVAVLTVFEPMQSTRRPTIRLDIYLNSHNSETDQMVNSFYSEDLNHAKELHHVPAPQRVSDPFVHQSQFDGTDSLYTFSIFSTATIDRTGRDSFMNETLAYQVFMSLVSEFPDHFVRQSP